MHAAYRGLGIFQRSKKVLLTQLSDLLLRWLPGYTVLDILLVLKQPCVNWICGAQHAQEGQCVCEVGLLRAFFLNEAYFAWMTNLAVQLYSYASEILFFHVYWLIDEGSFIWSSSVHCANVTYTLGNDFLLCSHKTPKDASKELWSSTAS